MVGETGFELDLGHAAKFLAGRRFPEFPPELGTISQPRDSNLMRPSPPYIARVVALALQDDPADAA